MTNLNVAANRLAADDSDLDDDDDIVPVIVPGKSGADKGYGHTITELKKRVGGGGVGNLTFFSRTADLSLGTSYADAVGGNYTPGSTDELVGILLSIGGMTSISTSNYAQGKLTRGGADLTPEMLGGRGGTWRRQLFLDEPNSISAQEYQWEARRSGTTARTINAGTTMAVFAMPDGVVADLITSDESVSQNTDFLSVTITPSSMSAIIKLNMLFMLAAETVDIQIRRGTVNIGPAIDATPELRTDAIVFPTNFEDWYDQPNTMSPVTYHIRKTNSGSDTIQKGSYLMAQEVA